LAELLGATLDGDPELLISGAATIAEAGPGDLVRIDSRRWAEAAEASAASAYLAPAGLEGLRRPCLRVADTRLAFAWAIAILHPAPTLAPGIHPAASIAADAEIGEGCVVMAHAVVGSGARLGRGVILHPNAVVGDGSRLGDETVLFSGVILYSRVVIGRRVRIHGGSVIGADGYGYVSSRAGHEKIPHVGSVVIEDDVEIGANVTIDRATTGATRIGAGTKIDNQVQIGHNCQIGRACLIVAQTGIGGSTTLGDGVVIGGHAGVSDNVEVVAGMRIAGFSAVWGDQMEPGTISGIPARPHRQTLHAQATFQRLPELGRQIAELQSRLARLEGER
jgi:UDP-3-O-[3-hydroxymyristoyl] glucosamine N-acyltransferase